MVVNNVMAGAVEKASKLHTLESYPWLHKVRLRFKMALNPKFLFHSILI